MSGVVNGVDPATGDFPDTLDEQCVFLFEQVDRIVTAAGGSMDDVVKFTVWMKDSSVRDALNRAWLERFPDAATRPARHTMQMDMAGKRLVQCDFTAFVESHS